MKNFNINRFWQLTKWNLITYRKTYVNTIFRVTATILFMLFVLTDLSYGDPNDLSHFNSFYPFAWVVFLCFMAATVAAAFNNMSKNGERLNYIMLPASNLEKFLMGILKSLVSGLVCFIAGLVLADLLHMLIELVWYHHTISIFNSAMLAEFHDLMGNVHYEYNSDGAMLSYTNGTWIAKIGALFVLHSILTLGSVFFRKHHLVLTFLTTCIVSMAVTFMITWAATFFVEMYGPDAILKLACDKWIIEAIGHLISVSFIVLMYWFSYRIFCRMEVKNSRLFNI